MPSPPKSKLRTAVTKALVHGTKSQQEHEISNLESRLRDLELQMQDIQAVAGTGDDDDGEKMKGLYNLTPPDIAPAGARGTSSRASRGNHTHRGVRSLTKSSTVFGDITLSGAGVVQTGNDFAISGAGIPGGLDTEIQFNDAGSFGGTTNLNWVDGVGVDFNTLMAIAMVCDQGATLPTSPAPVKGQWFLHTPTGRNVLMMYSGSAWIPLASLGSMTMYVDSGSGTDSQNNGGATGASAFDTLQFAVNQIPGLVGGDVTINLAATMDYAEAVVIRDKSLTGNYTITVQGTLPTADDTGTGSGAGLAFAANAAGFGMRQAALNDTTKTWGMGTLADSGTTSATTATKLVEAGQNFLTTVAVGMVVKNTTDTTYARVVRVESDTTLLLDTDIMTTGETYEIGWGEHGGGSKLIVITGGTGSGQYRVIEANYATRIHVVGVWDTTPGATSTYAIYDMEDFATIDATSFGLTSETSTIEVNNQKGLVLKYLNIESWAGGATAGFLGFGVYVKNFSAFSLLACRLYNNRAMNTGAAIQVESFSIANHINAVTVQRGSSCTLQRGLRVILSGAPARSDSVNNSRFYDMTVAGINAFAALGGESASGHGNVIRKAGNTGMLLQSFCRWDMRRTIITQSASSGALVRQAYLFARALNEVSSSGTANISVEATGVLETDGTTSQYNYATTYGIRIDPPAAAIGNYTSQSFTGNTLSSVLDVSGKYTPTPVNVANVSASTGYECQWARLGTGGTMVHVTGKIDVDPTLTATLTQVGIPLPVPSNLGAEEDCAGVAFASGIAGQGAAIRGDAANDRAEMVWIAGDITNQPMFFSFSYEVL